MPWGKLKDQTNVGLNFQWLSRLSGLSHLPLFVTALLITFCGLLTIYSSSAILGFQQFGDSLYYVKKQAIFFGIGWALYFIVAQLPVIKLSSSRLLVLSVTVLLLALVLIPGVGQSGGGAQRWVCLGFVRFQPAEIVRLLLVFYLAHTLVVKAPRIGSFNKGFLPLLVVTSFLMFLLILQPDFGSAVSLLLISVSMWFIGGVPMTYLAGLFVFSLPAILFVLFSASYRAQRVMTFLDPWADPHGAGFQVIQSYLAFFRGGWTGLGLGQGEQKLFYLPKAHTDFIFSVIGEELGVLGVLVVVGLFVSLLVCGSRITRWQRSRVGYLMGAGVTLVLVLPAILNMMVTLGLLPTKGLPLPFFSSGGSSLIVSFIALGVLQSLYYHRESGSTQEELSFSSSS